MISPGRVAVLTDWLKTTVSSRLRLFASNASSAFRFAWRRVGLRGALAGRHEPWRRFTVLTAALIVFVAVYFDPVFAAVPLDWKSPALGIGQLITDIGLSGWYLVPLALFLVWTALVDWSALPRRERLALFNRTAAAWYAFVAIGGSGLLVTLLKQAVGRARPRLASEHGAFHFDPWSFDSAYASFPSGHATTVGAACFCVAIVCPKLRLFAIVAALWFGFSRAVVGAHWPSDVVAGLFLGGWFAYWVAIRFGKAGLVFLLPVGQLPQRRLSFHLLPLHAYRSMNRWTPRVDAMLHRLVLKRYDATRR